MHVYRAAIIRLCGTIFNMLTWRVFAETVTYSVHMSDDKIQCVQVKT